MATEYAKTATNKVVRHPERGHYDHETIHTIFNTTTVSHAAFIPDPSSPVPVCLPMLARIGGTYGPSSSACCYIHGAASARLFKISSSSSSTPSGIPICLTATKVDGLILALTPFNHSIQYRSATIHGTAYPLDPEADADENLFALRLLTDGLVPGRWEGSRVPPDRAELTATKVLRVVIEHASAKVNEGGVKDDRKDLRNEDVLGRVWAGVVPVYETVGVPVPAEHNRLERVPEYLEKWVDEYNRPAIERESKSAGGGGLMGFFGGLRKNLPF